MNQNGARAVRSPLRAQRSGLWVWDTMELDRMCGLTTHKESKKEKVEEVMGAWGSWGSAIFVLPKVVYPAPRRVKRLCG